MIERLIPLLLGLVFCISVSFAGYDDGFITTGEYEYGVWIEDGETLVVMGGGADRIDMWGDSCLEVRYTSTPIEGDWYKGGIRDITLNHDSKLFFQDGTTDLISLYGNSTAVISGGNINLLRSFQNSDSKKHITFVCDVDSVDLSGNLLTGDWLDGKGDFSITLLDQDPYDSVYSNINFIPEPTTLFLLGLGGLWLRKRRL